jgi:hypothetical protein
MPRARLPIHSKTTGPEKIGAACAANRGYQAVTEYRGPILISPIFIYLRQYDLQTADVPFDQT